MLTSIIICLIIPKSFGEFTSLPNLITLVKTEAAMKTALDNYIQIQREKLAKLKKYSETFDIRINNDQLDVEAKIANPISAHSLIERLFVFKTTLLPLIKDSRDNAKTLQAIIESSLFPDGDDLNGALGAILKLQRVYNLSTQELAKGEIFGKAYTAILTSNECRQLGEYAANNSYFSQAIDWFKIAKRKLKTPEIELWENYFNRYIIYSFHQGGFYEEGVEFIDEILKENPTNNYYLNYKNQFEEASKRHQPKALRLPMEEMTFKEYCKNNYDMKSLKCSYKFKKHPFLSWAPFKMEEISQDPDIFLIHDILSNNEIELLKALSFEKMKIFDQRFPYYQHLTRNCSSVFIQENAYSLLSIISQRIEDITHLTLASSEPFQISNYGVGGFYNPHVDFFGDISKQKFNLNDRTATISFYLTDVEYGGATIFPNLKITVTPKKGSALFWYNLHTNGDGDARTLHGECPVLLGSKWELHSSIAGLLQLASTEAQLKSALDDYISKQELYINKLERFQDSLREVVNNGIVNEDSLTMNPLNAFKVIKNLNEFSTNVIPLIVHKLTNDTKSQIFDSLTYPTQEDLTAARAAIYRVQSTYKLPLEDLIKGKIFGVKYEGALSVNDCLYIGIVAAEELHFKEAEDWFKIGLKYAEDNERETLMLNLVYVLLVRGKFGEGWRLTEELLGMNPDNREASEFRVVLENILINDHKSSTPNDTGSGVLRQFQAICRSEFVRQNDDLKCFYKSTNPFTRLAPFKVEEKYQKPDILVYHDVLSNAEISKLQGLAFKGFARSLVAQTNSSVRTKLRISESAAVYKHSDKMIPKIIQRVEDMTGLSQKYNEIFQVANYGLGGMYYPHYDYLLLGDPSMKSNGNRIASVLFYLTNVTYGGATAFVNLKTAITPIKGSAIFWYNTHTNGKQDDDAAHGACPVLLGTKWIGTQWIREFGQEFIRPCLKSDSETDTLN